MLGGSLFQPWDELSRSGTYRRRDAILIKEKVLRPMPDDGRMS
jgi:hypothetical protein